MKKIVLITEVKNDNGNTFDVDAIRHSCTNANDVVLGFFNVNEEEKNRLFWYAIKNNIDFEQTKEDIYFIVSVAQIESITNI